MSDKFQPQGPPVPAPPVALPLPLGASTHAAQTDGTQQTIVRGGAKGGTVAATVTSTSVDANHQGLDVYAAALPLPTGAATETGNLATLLARFAARTASVALTASAPLPAAGAYDAVPAQGVMTAVPVGSRRATIRVKYTRGAIGGQAAHKIYVSDGTNPMQAMSPDGTYAGVYGAASTGAGAIYYAIPVDLLGGETHIWQCGAEVGVTGTPGTVETAVTFG